MASLSVSVCAMAAVSHQPLNQLMEFSQTTSTVDEGTGVSYLLAGVSFFTGQKVEGTHSLRQSEINFLYSKASEKGWNFDAGFIYTNESESLPYPNVQQAYYKMGQDKSRVEWGLGRKLENWSLFDRTWQMGLWQPNVATNLMRPYEQGLTGLFVDFKTDAFKFTGFLSPIFVPTFGPQFKVKEGQLLSSNRWFQSPISRVQIKDVDVDVSYDIKTPKVMDVVNNMSVAFKGLWGAKRGPFAQVAMAFKPMNALHVQFKRPSIILDENDELIAPIVIYPKVVMHSVTTLELGWKSRRFNSWMSISDERPSEPELEADMNQPKIVKNQFFAIHLEHDLKLIGQQTWQMQWGAFKRVDNIAVSEVIDDDLNVDFSELRYPYSEAVMVGINMDLHLGWPVKVSAKLTHSPSNSGTALTADIQTITPAGYGLILSMDVIGAEDQESESFFNRYRNNDRFFGGISYVF